MNICLFAAGVVSTAVFLIHTFVGGREIAAPLLAAKDLHPVPKFTQYYCWHLVTIVLAAMAAAYGFAAIDPSARDLAAFVTFLAAAFSVFGLILAPAKGQKYKHMPQGWLFVPVTALGVIGLLA